VITIQDNYDDFLLPIRERLKNGKGNLRKNHSDYLAYAIADLVVDNYYPLFEKIADRLDELEDELIEKPTRHSLNKLLQVKRDLIVIRRVVWSERDKVNDIIRSHIPMIREGSKIFFRDTYDHCIQLIDMVESHKEVTASLMDVYQSGVSNRLNQVMKVLTIMSTIFIPLTFIVGLYGMNFMHTDPVSGERLPLNMPELYSPYGYLGVVVVMILIVIIQLIFFIKKGWITKG
jgi:magnesium transporter